MEKRIRDYVKYTLVELENYTKLEESCVKKVTSNTHLSFPPHGLGNIHETLLKIFSKKKIGFFDPKLHGIILEIRNIKVLDNKAIIHFNSVYSHIDIQADFYIFQPTIGSIVKGVIKHVSDRQIGVIIYRVFSVAIKLKEKTKRKLEINSEIEIRIKNFDLENLLPYIEGELILPKKISGNRFNENLNQTPIEKFESIHLSSDSSDDEMDQFRNKALCPAVNLNESSDEDEGDTQINRYKNPAVLNESQQIAHKAVPNSKMTGKTTFEISSSDDMSSDENTARVQSNKKNLANLSATSKHESENTTGSDTDDEDEEDDRSHTVKALHKNLDRNAKKYIDSKTSNLIQLDKFPVPDIKQEEELIIESEVVGSAELETLQIACQRKSSESDSNSENSTTNIASTKPIDNRFLKLSSPDMFENTESELLSSVPNLVNIKRPSTSSESDDSIFERNAQINFKTSTKKAPPIKEETLTLYKGNNICEQSHTSQLKNVVKNNNALFNNNNTTIPIKQKDNILSPRKADHNFAKNQSAQNIEEPITKNETSIYSKNEESTMKSSPNVKPKKTNLPKSKNTTPKGADERKMSDSNLSLINEKLEAVMAHLQKSGIEKSDLNESESSVKKTPAKRQKKSSLITATQDSPTIPSGVTNEVLNVLENKNTTPKGADERKMSDSNLSQINEKLEAVMAYLQKSGIEKSDLNESESSVKKTPAKRQKKSTLITATQDSPTITSGVTNEVLNVLENLMNLVNKKPVVAEASVESPTKKKPAAQRKRKSSVDNEKPAKKPRKKSITKVKEPEMFNETAALAALSRNSPNRSRSESSSPERIQAEDETKAKKPKNSRKKPEPKVSESDKLAVDLGSLTTSKPGPSSEAKIKNPKKPKKKPEPKIPQNTEIEKKQNIQTASENDAAAISDTTEIQPKPSKRKYERKKKTPTDNIQNVAASSEKKVNDEVVDQNQFESIADGPKKKTPVRRKSTAVRKSLLESNTNESTETKTPVVQSNSEQIGLVSKVAPNLAAPVSDSTQIKTKRPYKKRAPKTQTESVDKKQEINLPESEIKVNNTETDAPKKKTPVRRKSTSAPTKLLESNTNETKIPVVQPNSDQIGIVDNLTTNLAGSVSDSTGIKPKRPYKKREPKTKTESVDKKQKKNLSEPENDLGSSSEKKMNGEALDQIHSENITDAPKKKTPVRRKSTAARPSTNKSTETKISVGQTNSEQIGLFSALAPNLAAPINTGSEIQPKKPKNKYERKKKTEEQQQEKNLPQPEIKVDNIQTDAPKKKTPAKRKSTAAPTKPLDSNTNESTETKIPVIQSNGDQIELTGEPPKKKAPARRKSLSLSLTKKNVVEKPTASTDSLVEQKVLEVMKQTLPTTDISSLVSNDLFAAFISKITSDVKTSLNENNLPSATIKKPAQKRKNSTEKKTTIKKSKTTPAISKSETSIKAGDNRKSVSFSDTTDIKDAPDGSLFLTPKMSSTVVNNESI